MRFWLSWIQPTEDYRPLTYPPNASILGWWCSGYDADDQAILCAVVESASADAAKAAVKRDWPEADTWRYCDAKPSAWRPGDRFPLEPWMKTRFGGGRLKRGWLMMLESVRYRLESLYWWARKYLVFVRHLPILKCPACHGKGGEVSGYEEPEWMECFECYDSYKHTEDYGLDWTVGRLSPWRWPWAWLWSKTGHYTFRGWLLCKLGCHRWDDDMTHPIGVCLRCWASKDGSLDAIGDDL